ncbi:MAG: hypothetical protein ABI597_14035 [Gammaproteobacteria bacterium]
MNRYLIQIIIPLLFCIPAAYAQDLERDYVLKTAQTITYVDQHQADVWPGFHISATPTILHFDDTGHLYAYDFTPKNSQWQKIIVNDTAINFLAKDEYKLKGETYDFNVPIDDQSSYIVGQPFDENTPQDTTKNMFLFAHERFHMYQVYESKRPQPTRSLFDGHNQLTNVKLSYLEMKAYDVYLRNKFEKAEDALKDAVAVHQYRESLLNKDSLAYEQDFETIEGTAAYVGWKSLNLSDDEYIQRVISWQQTSTCNSMTNLSDIQSCLYNSWFYYTGGAAGRALDQKMTSSSWKTAAEIQGKPLDSVLQEYYHMSLEEAKIRTEKAMQNSDYSYNQIDQAMDAALNPYLNEMAQQVNAYKLEPGIELQINLGQGYSPEHSDKSYIINTNLELLTNVSDDSQSDDNTLEIHYKNIPLFYNAISLRVIPEEYWQKFKISAETKITLDNSNDTAGNYISNNKDLPFHRLIIENSNVVIKLDHVNGRLTTVDGALKLKIISETTKE